MSKSGTSAPRCVAVILRGLRAPVPDWSCESGPDTRGCRRQVVAASVTGTDFGCQHGPLVSPRTYRDLYQPFHVQVNDWIHPTPVEGFIHSCGSIWALLPDFVDAGFDIINPVQCSAAGMAPCGLKQEFGARLTFWGGGVDTQHTLPFGTPDEVRKEFATA